MQENAHRFSFYENPRSLKNRKQLVLT